MKPASLAALAIAAFCLGHAPARAEAKADACISQTADETAARACFDEQVAWAWEELDKSWFAALEAVGGPQTPAGKALVAEKDAWMEYQAAACRVYTVEQDGLVEYGLTQRCQQMLVSARAADLDFNISKLPTNLRHQP